MHNIFFHKCAISISQTCLHFIANSPSAFIVLMFIRYFILFDIYLTLFVLNRPWLLKSLDINNLLKSIPWLLGIEILLNFKGSTFLFPIHYIIIFVGRVIQNNVKRKYNMVTCKLLVGFHLVLLNINLVLWTLISAYRLYLVFTSGK